MTMSAERNKARMLELIERVMNGHDLDALSEYTSNPSPNVRRPRRPARHRPAGAGWSIPPRVG
jgi:hypothetical protein